MKTEFWCGGDRAWYGSFGVSAIVHVGLVVALGCLWASQGAASRALQLDTHWTESADRQAFEDPRLLQPEVARPVLVAGGSRSVAASLQTLSESTLPNPRIASSTYELTDTYATEDVSEQVELGTAGGDAADGRGQGDGDGDGTGDGQGAGFFGLNVPGRRFVFVVDCSRSMNHPHDSPAKTRFKRLKLELVSTIGKMRPEMEFYIIFFNRKPIPMPSKSLRSATVRNQHKYLYWMQSIRADGETDPTSALRMALRLKPDIVYFLTDGSFENKVTRKLQSIRQRQVAIHTIAFGERSAEELLRQLARQNRGRYRYVP